MVQKILVEIGKTIILVRWKDDASILLGFHHLIPIITWWKTRIAWKNPEWRHPWGNKISAMETSYGHRFQKRWRYEIWMGKGSRSRGWICRFWWWLRRYDRTVYLRWICDGQVTWLDQKLWNKIKTDTVERFVNQSQWTLQRWRMRRSTKTPVKGVREVNSAWWTTNSVPIYKIFL